MMRNPFVRIWGAGQSNAVNAAKPILSHLSPRKGELSIAVSVFGKDADKEVNPNEFQMSKMQVAALGFNKR
jgi:hypothetical protein